MRVSWKLGVGRLGGRSEHGGAIELRVVGLRDRADWELAEASVE